MKSSHSSTLLEVRNLTITADFGGKQTVPILDSLTASFASPGFTALVGPNGSGKSTLLRALMGRIDRHLTPSPGVYLEGRPLSAFAPLERGRRMAFMPQNAPQGIDFTVKELIETGDYPWTQGVPAPGRQPPSLASLLQRLQLEELAHRRFDTLSAGEKQKALYGRLLRQDTPILLLDEPSANLDLKYQLFLGVSLKKQAASGRCVVAALHDLNQALRFAQQVIVLQNGRIRAQGTPRETLTPDLVSQVWGLPLFGGTHSGTGNYLLDNPGRDKSLDQPPRDS